MDRIKRNDKGPAVEDVQQRLVAADCLSAGAVSGVFDDATVAAVRAFCVKSGLPAAEEVDEKVWVALVDATFSLGDRTLYRRMRDVRELQQVLSALGFACGVIDGIFGAHTEDALRKFQLNLGLPSDGIAGAYTYAAIQNLHHSWVGKAAIHEIVHLGFARAADVLEQNALCLFGTEEFARSVASRMSNLSLATNPQSKILSADSLLVAPDESMLLVHIVLPEEEAVQKVPRVSYEDEATLPLRLEQAIVAARKATSRRIAIELPGRVWEDAGEGRSAQHFAITLLDALCTALSQSERSA